MLTDRLLGSPLQVLENCCWNFLFLCEIGTEPSGNVWSVDLTLNNSSVRFKIDIGANVFVIPERIYKTIQPLPSLAESSKTLYGPAETTLPVRGYFMGTIQRGDKTAQQEIIVVTGTHQTLLGRPAVEALNVVERVKDVEAKYFKTKFPKLFKVLGKLHGPEYIIMLKPDAKPHALCTPRRVPLPLLSKVRELSRMEKNGDPFKSK